MATFEYKNGRYFKDGNPFFFIGVDYQYYRDERKNWKDRLQQLKDAKCNVITFYIPWRHHLVMDGEKITYDFSGKTKDSRDIITFIKLIEDLGLYYVAKPGPFVHSELNIGGLPDVACPSFNAKIKPVLTHRGLPLYWEYDHTQMPSPNDPVFDGMVKEWLGLVGGLLKDHMSPNGNLIGIQLNDETLYCSSNDAPWNFGYDEFDLNYFRNILKEKYGSISKYNELHQSRFNDFGDIKGPSLFMNKDEKEYCTPQKESDLLYYTDWAEFQWKIRTDFYDKYKKYLGVNLPHLSNFAGITAPIEENVPDAVEDAGKGTPKDFMKLYSDWWFGMNRVDTDKNVYEYGMISWLGVAAYNISDAKTEDRDRDCSRNEVFNRYINTARRRRGINMEENWGFARLYHPFSKYPLIPYYQTLASVAGGCTGYVVFTGVQHGYWDETLDKTTKKQHPTFPSDAPITSDGKLTPMYFTMKMMNEWFEKEGENYLKMEQNHDVCWLIYSPYAGVSSWVPNEKYWKIKDHKIPRCGVNSLEPFSMSLQENGFSHEMVELQSVSDEELFQKKTCAMRLGFFMDKSSQEKLVEYVKHGGTLILDGEKPIYDENMNSCTILSDLIKSQVNEIEKGRVFYSNEDLFSTNEILNVLSRLNIESKVKYSNGMRAFVYGNKEDCYLWFFNFESDKGPHKKYVEFYGKRIDLELGSKTSGVVHVKGKNIVSVMFKGKNEVEGVESEISIRYENDEVRQLGDYIKA